MVNNDFQKYIDLYRPVMYGMLECLGDRVEFILHDLSQPHSSVAAVVGNVTDRDIGAPATNTVMAALSKYGDDAADIIGYSSLSKTGRPLKSSTIFIRDEKGHIVGCFCYNLDLTDFQIAENLISSMCHIQAAEVEEKGSEKEVFAQGMVEVVEDIINFEIKKCGKPVPIMSKADKLQLVRQLESKGVFDVKGSVELLAHFLGTSIFTIYNYLKESRSIQKNY